MALISIVTKVSVLQNSQDDKIYILSANLSCTDSTVEVINQDFSVKYHSNRMVSEVEAELQVKMQSVVDKYKAEQVIFNAAAFDAALSNIQNNLVG